MKILKPGEEGYGYLVEYDSGFVSSELTCQDGVCSNHNLIKEFKSGIKVHLSIGASGVPLETKEVVQLLKA